MKFIDIEESLPNGLHDSYIESISINYSTKSVEINLKIWTGDMESPLEDIREQQKNAKLVLVNFYYFFIEPPNMNSPHKNKNELWIVATGEINELKNRPSEIPIDIPIENFANWLYINNWDAYIYFSAKQAKLIWQE